MIRLTALAVAFLLGLIVRGYGEEPAELLRLRAIYQQELSKVTSPIATKYREALKREEIKATMAGNLDAALAFRSELKTLAQPVQASIDLDGLMGRWTIHYTNGAERIYEIDESGKLSSVELTGKLKVENGSLLIRKAQGQTVERLVLHDSRLIVEHYNPKNGNDFDKGDLPGCMGLGRKHSEAERQAAKTVVGKWEWREVRNEPGVVVRVESNGSISNVQDGVRWEIRGNHLVTFWPGAGETRFPLPSGEDDVIEGVIEMTGKPRYLKRLR